MGYINSSPNNKPVPTSLMRKMRDEGGQWAMWEPNPGSQLQHLRCSPNPRCAASCCFTGLRICRPQWTGSPGERASFLSGTGFPRARHSHRGSRRSRMKAQEQGRGNQRSAGKGGCTRQAGPACPPPAYSAHPHSQQGRGPKDRPHGAHPQRASLSYKATYFTPCNSYVLVLKNSSTRSQANDMWKGFPTAFTLES